MRIYGRKTHTFCWDCVYTAYRGVCDVNMEKSAVVFCGLQRAFVNNSSLDLPPMYIGVEGADAQVPPERAEWAEKLRVSTMGRSRDIQQ